MTKIKAYSELIRIPTFEERLDYCREYASVGEDVFGFRRYLNQVFYKTKEWKDLRRKVILRDNGLDLGLGPVKPGEILYVHHLKPLLPEDIESKSEYLINPEYLITVTLDTHNAIHYGVKNSLPKIQLERKPGDTCPWK